MCGKFTAPVTWPQNVAHSQVFTGPGGIGRSDGADASEGAATYRVNELVPVIVWDAEKLARRVVRMRWGLPHPKDWRRSQQIHVRAETVDAKEPFRRPFHDGQRGIVLFHTFNEGEQVEKPSSRSRPRQWTIDPLDSRPRAFAFLWRRFDIADHPAPLLAGVMATVPANELIRRTIKLRELDPRMPAILEDEEA
jgi:putative SOS response-associated peptidase YedK